MDGYVLSGLCKRANTTESISSNSNILNVPFLIEEIQIIIANM